MSAGGARIRNLWLEFEDQQSPEAIFVAKVDKLHVAFTALRYEIEDRCPYSLQPFWDYARSHVCDTPLIEVFNNLNRQRPRPNDVKPLLQSRPNKLVSFEDMRFQVLAKIGLNL